MAENDTKLMIEKPYFPAGGMNIDSNGVGTYDNEATKIVNMVIHSHDIRTRPGTTTITPPGGSIPGESVLHYAEYKYPTGQTVLFAFTESSIYAYNTTTGWVSVIAVGLFSGNTVNFWSTTTYIDDVQGATLVAAGSWVDSPTSALQKGDERILCYYSQTTSKFETLVLYQNVPVVDEQLLNVLGVAITVPAITPTAYAVGVTYLAKDISKWEVRDDPNADEIHLSINIVYVEDDGEEPPEATPAEELIPVVSVLMWTSTPTLTTDIELATRAQITITCGYQDPYDTGSNLKYVQAQAIEAAIKGNELANQIVEVEDSSFGIDYQASSETFFNAGEPGIISGDLAHQEGDDDFIAITAGTFQITLGTGQGTMAAAGKAIHSLSIGKTTLGDASNGADIDCYRLIPTNESLTDFDNSWVRVDGREWQLSFLRDVYGGAELLGYYRYQEAIKLNPVHISTFHNALILGNLYVVADLTYMPWRIQWSSLGDFTEFDYDNYQDLIIREVAAITGFKAYNTVVNRDAATFLFIFQENTVSRGSFDKDIFLSIDTAIPEGLEYIRTLCEADNVMYYMGKNDIYAFDGLNRESITTQEKSQDSRIREWIFDNLDIDEQLKNFSVYDPMRRLIMFFLMFKTNTEDYSTDVVVYDLDKKGWVIYTMPETSAAISLSLDLPEVV